VRAFGQALDVADGAALGDWVTASARKLGGIDALVCNVSALAVGDNEESWDKSFRTDMMHTVNAVAAAVPFLEKSSDRRSFSSRASRASRLTSRPARTARSRLRSSTTPRV
jgi:NAD(P)-dependent dehydrogenase (short-subunit alcohol dehydrogenase family)